jgi:CO/xanthine dehydrogenase Mo-binding subunit
MLDIAFSRSPLAHARMRGIEKPAGSEERVFTHADLDGVMPIRAVAGLPGFKPSEQPVLAVGKVSHVGEMIAMCLAETRAAAEDLVAEIVAGWRAQIAGPVHSHGQGLETMLARIAYEVFGVETAQLSLVHGDTALTPYSTGTWGSLCAGMAGGG